MTEQDILAELRDKLVVSCQAPPGDPLEGPSYMAAMATAALAGGAAGIRAEGIDDIEAIRAVTTAPLIGLWKVPTEETHITPTIDRAIAVARAGADIVAFDATRRPRPDGSRTDQMVAAIHAENRLAMADIANVDDAAAALEAGSDMVSTTLSGYVPQRPSPAGPDLALVADLTSRFLAPVFAEGRISTPAEGSQALRAGAFSVVVGTAITAPGAITASFASALVGGL
ncbi:N-acetylmannosamine-6-phosphate 2-epimerase [Nocardiopsis nanhaiensis]